MVSAARAGESWHSRCQRGRGSVAFVEPPPSAAVTAELRRAVLALIERLDSRRANVATAWSGFAGSCGVDSTAELSETNPEALVIFGTTEDVLNRVQHHEDEFGFVVPASVTVRPWQSGRSWIKDPTILFWRLGWSPVVVERIKVTTEAGIIEFAVGNARRTPAVSVSPLDDAD